MGSTGRAGKHLVATVTPSTPDLDRSQGSLWARVIICLQLWDS